MNITKLYDKPGWAYFFIAQEMAKYSSHKIQGQPYNKIDFENMDILLISSPNIQPPFTNRELPLIAKEKGIKVIGQYSGEVKCLYSHADLIVTISPQTYYFAREKYPHIPVIFLPECIDTDYFNYPEREYNDRFVVGFAGGVHKPVKRTHLFKYLNFPIKIQSEHGKEFFKENRILEPMKEFYKSIDCLIITSSSECQPRVAMEAMAMGLPVISTDVGSIPLILNKDVIVPTFPENDLIKEMNNKLNIYKNNLQLRKEHGYGNRWFIERQFSWKIRNISTWDLVFELVKNNDINTLLELNHQIITSYGDVFNYCKKYQGQIDAFMEK